MASIYMFLGDMTLGPPVQSRFEGSPLPFEARNQGLERLALLVKARHDFGVAGGFGVGPALVHLGPAHFGVGPACVHVGPACVHVGPTCVHFAPAHFGVGPVRVGADHGADTVGNNPDLQQANHGGNDRDGDGGPQLALL